MKTNWHFVTRRIQIETLSQMIKDDDRFTGRLEDDYLECLAECLTALHKMILEGEDNDDSRSDK